MSELASRDSFYVIVGSAAGALIGLQFVVMTLVAQKPQTRLEEGAAAFVTPTIVHFSIVLLVSAPTRIPWQSVSDGALAGDLVALTGVIYALMIARRMRSQSVYKPEFEDWLYHALLPLAAYVLLLASSLDGPMHTRISLFGVALSVLGLLFIAIHNAWDTITYHVFVRLNGDSRQSPDKPASSEPAL